MSTEKEIGNVETTKTIVYTTPNKSTHEIEVDDKDLDKVFDKLDKVMPSVYVKTK